MNPYLKAKIYKIISKSSKSKLEKYLNSFKYHTDNSIVKEIMIMINQNLSKRKNYSFTCLTITPIGSKRQKYPDIEITIIHEYDFNYDSVVILLKTELYRLNLKLIQKAPVFRAIAGTDKDVIQGGEFEKEAKYSVKVKFLYDKENTSEANSNSIENNYELNLTNSQPNEENSQSKDSVISQENQFLMHPIHEESNVSNNSSSSHSSYLSQNLSNLSHLNIDSIQINHGNQQILKTERSEAYSSTQKEENFLHPYTKDI